MLKFSSSFLEELKTAKLPFEMNWPLYSQSKLNFPRRCIYLHNNYITMGDSFQDEIGVPSSSNGPESNEITTHLSNFSTRLKIG